MNQKRISQGDLKLILALLLAGAMVAAFSFFARQDGHDAVVERDGQVVARVPLARDGLYPIEADGTVTNLLRVEGGAIRMEEADCPDHLCIHKGAIRYVGDSIICLPNRVVVRIAGSDALDLDAVTG